MTDEVLHVLVVDVPRAGGKDGAVHLAVHFNFVTKRA